MQIRISVRGAGAIIPLPDGWPGVAELAGLAEAMSRTTRECPICPGVPASAFLLAIADQTPPDLAARLRDLAAHCD